MPTVPSLPPGFFETPITESRWLLNNNDTDRVDKKLDTDRVSNSVKEYKLYSKDNSSIGHQVKNYAHEALFHIQEVSLFSLLFFSQENINNIQELLKYNVYLESNKTYKIGNQDERELKLIMRAVYLEHGRVPNNRKEYTNAIKHLNNLTIHRLLPDLLSNIKQHVAYLHDISNPYKIMDTPVNPSSTGQKNNRDITNVLFGTSVEEYNKQYF